MSVREYPISVFIDGVEVPVSPKTDATTVYVEGERLSNILDKNVPIRLTLAEYGKKVEAGEITDDSEEIYIITDDVDETGKIADSVVSKNTTYSSYKILELISGGSGQAGANITRHIFTLEPDKWLSDNGCYTYPIIVIGSTEDSLVTVTLANLLSQDEYIEQEIEANRANIFRIHQSGNTLIISANGVRPTKPIKIDVTVIN